MVNSGSLVNIAGYLLCIILYAGCLVCWLVLTSWVFELVVLGVLFGRLAWTWVCCLIVLCMTPLCIHCWLVLLVVIVIWLLLCC